MTKKTPPEQPKEYIITEEQLENVDDWYFLQQIAPIIRSRPATAPTSEPCCISCPNIPCKKLNRVPCVHHPENVCIENGCTDIEDCDEICEHSRIYSPAWVKQHDTSIRNAAKTEGYEQALEDVRSACIREEIEAPVFRVIQSLRQSTEARK